MSWRTFLLLLSLLLLALFTALNWNVFLAPATLSLGFTQVEAPLGLIMLLVTGVFCGMFMLYIVVQQVHLFADARRYAKELSSQRELADRAEASRFTDLQRRLDGQFEQLRESHAREEALARQQVAELERRLNERLDESTRVLTAYLGEVEDKLDRGTRPPTP